MESLILINNPKNKTKKTIRRQNQKTKKKKRHRHKGKEETWKLQHDVSRSVQILHADIRNYLFQQNIQIHTDKSKIYTQF